jgi:hypothetical protein
MKHDFKPFGGMKENPGVWDNGRGGIVYVARCVCSVRREIGKDYTGSRPANTFGPFYYDAEGRRIPRSTKCTRPGVRDRIQLGKISGVINAFRG